MKILKIAQDRKPFKIYKTRGGEVDLLINTGIIWATSPEQARLFAMDKFPALRSYVEGCLGRNQECDIVARIDKAKLEEIRTIDRAQQELKEKKEQNAWWND